MSMIKKAGLCGAVLLLATVAAIPQNNSTQVVFSDTGATMPLSGNSKAGSTPFGFWIWCGGSGAYQTACQGNMYFYALQPSATPVVGFVTETPSGSGIYTMNIFQGTFADFLHGKLNPAYVCTLTNTMPNAHGPGNTVQVNCTFANSLGGGTGSLTDTGTVVNITGPSN